MGAQKNLSDLITTTWSNGLHLSKISKKNASVQLAYNIDIETNHRPGSIAAILRILLDLAAGPVRRSLIHYACLTDCNNQASRPPFMIFKEIRSSRTDLILISMASEILPLSYVAK